MFVVSPTTGFMKRELVDQFPDFIDKDLFEKINLVGSTLQVSGLLPDKDRRKILFEAGKFTSLIVKENFNEAKNFEFSELSLDGQIKLEKIESAVMAGEKISEQILEQEFTGDQIVEIFDPAMLNIGG